MTKVGVAHCTTAHPRTDTRIRVKEVATLARFLEAPVELFVQDGLGDEAVPGDGYRIRDLGPRPSSRLARMILGPWRMARALGRERPDVVHLHDPELLWVAPLLRLSGARVVYDVHEDLPRQVLAKHYLPRWLRAPLSGLATLAEWVVRPWLAGFVAATPTIARRFPSGRTVLVRNFPILSEFEGGATTPEEERPAHFAYFGAIGGTRGLFAMVAAMERVESPGARLQLAGAFASVEDERRARRMPGWERVDYLGWLDRTGVAALTGASRAGLVVLEPTESYVEALPVKLFEYMAAGLPVIASDFPLWREIVDGAGAGLLVDPMDPVAIAGAMDWILMHPAEAAAMGERGRLAVRERYGWEAEGSRLLGFYREQFGLAPRAGHGFLADPS